MWTEERAFIVATLALGISAFALYFSKQALKIEKERNWREKQTIEDNKQDYFVSENNKKTYTKAIYTYNDNNIEWEIIIYCKDTTASYKWNWTFKPNNDNESIRQIIGKNIMWVDMITRIDVVRQIKEYYTLELT